MDLGSAILFGLILAAIIAGIAYAIVARRYHQTSEYAWRYHVFRHAADLREHRRQLATSTPPPPEVAVEAARTTALRDAVRTISLDRLTEQPGIGPGAIALLRQSGVSDVSTASRTNLEAINGIGPQKAASLRFAASRLIRECEQSFSEGRSPEGASFAAQADDIRASATESWNRRQRAIASIDAALAAHRESEQLASKATLLRFVRKEQVPGLTAEHMQKPFPEPDLIDVGTTPSKQSLSISPRTESGKIGDDTPGGLSSDRATPTTIQPPWRHPLQDRLEAFARFGVMVAVADDRSAQAELKVVRAFLGDVFGHEPELLRRIDPLIELSRASDPDVERTIAEVNRLAEGRQELTRLYRWAEQIADASSGRNDREAALLQRIADRWRFAPNASPLQLSTAPAPLANNVSSSIDPRTELGIPPDVEITADLVRRRFRLVVDQIEAARLDGLGPEFLRLVAMKREKSEAAALALLKPIGASLSPPAEPPPPADLRHNPDLDAVFGA